MTSPQAITVLPRSLKSAATRLSCSTNSLAGAAAPPEDLAAISIWKVSSKPMWTNGLGKSRAY